MSFKLVSGVGSEATGACWMAALNMFTRKDASWNDVAPLACISPVIRTLCISLNDLCRDGEREALIGPHLFDPVGTMDPALEVPRARLAARFARDVFVPLANAAVEVAKIKDSAVRHQKAAEIRACVLSENLRLILECVALGKDESRVTPTCSKERVIEELVKFSLGTEPRKETP